VCSVASLHAQDPVYRVLDYKAGLPSNSVYNILQDSRGYIWMAHDKGLSRYNGLNFEHFSSNVIQSRALSNLAEDKDGRIWCENFTGDLFYVRDKALVKLDQMRSTGNFVPFIVYRGSKIVSTRDNKLQQYDIAKENTEWLQIPGIKFSATNVYEQNNIIYSFSEASRKICAIKDQKLFWSVNLPAGMSPFHLAIGGNRVYVMPKTGTDKMLIIQNGKILKETSLGIPAIIQNVNVLDNRIWVSTTEGAYSFDLELNIQNGGRAYFRNCNISKVLQDAEGLLWFSTLNKGVLLVPNLDVVMLNPGVESITTLQYLPALQRLLLGTEDNKLFELNENTWSAVLLKDFGIRHDVTLLYHDISNDRFFVSSDKMYALSGIGNVIEFQKSIPMKDVVFLGNETYALASPEGIVLFKTTNDTTDQYFAKLFTGHPLPWISNRQLLPGTEGRAKCVAYDPIHKILYGSSYTGLFSMGQKKRIINYKNKIGEHIYASDIVVRGGRAFVSTYRGRLLVLESGKIIHNIESFRGLESKSIVKIQESGDFLWLLFENALVKYNMYKNTYSVISVADGLPNTEIKDITSANGIVYLATREGLVVFRENINSKVVNPRLVIEEFSVNNVVLSNPLNSYELGTSENNLEVGLGIMSYSNNSEIEVFYNINEKGWIRLGSVNRMLHLVGLAPGKYEVRFKAISVSGRETISPEVLRFRIAAPIYARWWFLLLLLILVSALVFYFMRFRLYELKKEAEYRTAKEKLERELQISTLASIKSQMNPHFVFNALNTVQSYIFTNDRDNATDYLQKFSELTRMILDMSTREKINLSEEIKALTLYLELEKRRFEDTIEYQIVVNENIAPEMVQIPSMLIQPYVENAIKHGLLHKKGDRKLKVEFVKEGNAVIAFIDDNGIGRRKSQEMKASKPSSHRSFASEANKRRLQLLNQGRKNTIDIEYLDKMDSYGNPLGTMVILAIPLNF